jgi:hypothetical protein
LLHGWVSPGGRIKRFQCSYRGMDVPNKEFCLKGTVTKTYSEGGKHYVELDIWGENEDGQKTTPGTAVVTLPSRSG